MHTLTDRQERALRMRRDGMKLREIARELGITPGRARALVTRAGQIERQSQWAEGLPARHVRRLHAGGIGSLVQLHNAAAVPGALRQIPGIGAASERVIRAWLARQASLLLGLFLLLL